ncbi:MAG: hypothetical protein JSS09_05015 [Verrucomicrobia bacterium]|nr:hypothetical protein [Verrucomicrobiota bacterium]
MRKNSFPLWVLYFSTFCLQGFSQNEDLPPPLQVTLKHIEGKGIGYNEGYSTLEGFFAPTNHFTGDFVPFIDARMHIFNNGLPAATGGLGIRYLSKRALGLNAYYDFRKTHHRHYNQISVGFESLGKIWDFRINGYLPIFGKISSPFDIKFGHFKDHSLILSEKKEFALKSIQAEVATHAIKIRHSPAYLAAGPYYLTGPKGAAWGGRARLAFDFFSYFTAEGSASYDSMFQGIIQGQISLNIPLGPSKQSFCKEERTKLNFAHQRVDRNEIIPVEKKRFNAVAINPATQDPYVFWFVDNTSHSNGTFESPFPKLSQAESHANKNDVIYVFPGDGTDFNLDTGFVMKKGQRLFGSGIKQTVPTQQKHSIVNVTIPAMTKNSPIIALEQNPGYARGVVNLADYTEVSGIHITSSSMFLGNKFAAILGGPATTAQSNVVGVKKASIHNNVIEGDYYQGGIYLHNSKKSIYAVDNTLQSLTAFNGIAVINDISNICLSTNISDNKITSSEGRGIFFRNTDGTSVSDQNILIASNTISGIETDGIAIINSADTIASSIAKQTIQILDNKIQNSGENGIFVLNNQTVSVAFQSTKILYNTISNSTNGRGIYFVNNGVDMTISKQQTQILNNNTSNTFLEGIYVLNYNDITMDEQKTLIAYNTVSNSSTTGIGFSNNLTITSQDQVAVLERNSISTSSDGGIYLLNQGPSTNYPTCFILIENKINDSVDFGMKIETYSASSTNVSFTDNIVNYTTSSLSLDVVSHNTSSICAKIIGNELDKNIVFNQQDSSQIFVAPLKYNSYLNIVGSYTPVPKGTCDCAPQPGDFDF